MDASLLAELKRYVGWTGSDEDALRELHPLAQPHFAKIVAAFYDRILEHQEARAVLASGESQLGHLKVQLTAWLGSLLRGPWDESWYQQRARIGRMHVEIALPQHYMFAAMNVIRRGLEEAIAEQASLSHEKQARARTALARILDLELAIMLHTYREALLVRQARAERLATFGQMAASIGHELRNPLSVIDSSVHLLRTRKLDEEHTSKHIERIGAQVVIAGGIISGLLDLISDRPLRPREVHLAVVVESALQLLKAPPGLALSREGLDALPAVQGDPDQLRQALTNLIENAMQAASLVAPSVVIRGARVDGHVLVSVEDNGRGVDPSIRARLFEPLITTKPGGTGLGLSLVRRIAARHGGSVAYAPLEPGARFTLALPAAAG